VLRIDNDGELCGNEFEEFCKKCGIYRKKNTPYTPQQNGVVERMNRSLMEKSRSMLSGAGLGHELWEETVGTACYLVNRSPSSTLVEKTSHEVWNGKKPSLEHIRVFGCDAYAHVPMENMSNLDNKDETCVYLLVIKLV
jgi:transposase InsO family protein